jgi:uncharacterized protein YyaL (SSP411 family)
MQRNRLAAESSPYLKQHADNPVDWYPWGEAALRRARADNKPILLSIGYSACHWCHVMAHESFEDPHTAELMNRLFVNIKVDREERPDLDRIYQAAQQMITQGSGGWPLTMFLTPEQQPFFGGTYFPKAASFGLPAFTELLQRVAQYHQEHGAEIAAQNVQLQQAFAALLPPPAATGLVMNDLPLRAGRAALARSFDDAAGGFTRAPKFPHASSIERCLRQWHATSGAAEPDLQALYMATLTLTRMAEGGIYDQLGGGFSRYSVDALWMIPHFEKMLYDNGLLLCEYARAALATGDPFYARITGETADWMMREMRSPEGGFYSSLDADSEHHEGRFYVWSTAEVQALLPEPQFTVFSRRYGLDRPANFEGAWHLHACESVERIAAARDESPHAVQALIDAARATLLAKRVLRIWPARDEKILTSWNALSVKGLAIAARVLRRPDLADAATAAVDFIHRHLWQGGRLLAACKDGRAHLSAYLDDYAFLLDALLELLQTRWRSRDLTFARALAEVLLNQFQDPANGGFFFTAQDHEALIHRSKTFSDDSVPSGNAIAASALTRLGFLLCETRYLAAAQGTLRAAWAAIEEYPQAHMSFLNGLEDFLSTLQILIIRGDAATAQRWAEQLQGLYAPLRMMFAIPDDAPELPPSLAAKRPQPVAVAYLCTGMTCSAPMQDLQQVSRQLKLRIET